MTGTLRVRSLAQKILFDEELSGQISDGQWENTMPYGHYKAWCDAEVVVDPENVGRDFYVSRDRYNLTNREFLETLETRMLAYVRLGLVYGQENAQKLEHVNSPYLNHEGEYWKDIRTFLLNFDVEKVREVYASDVVYSREQLVKDLRDLKTIMRTRSVEAVPA